MSNVIAKGISASLTSGEKTTARANLGVAIGTDVQAQLVSGTNIKTVNSTSLLGSGDVTIASYTDADALDLLNATGTAPVYACRAWVNFDGTTAGANPAPMTIRASGNVSSVTRNGTGDFTVNFTTAMPDENYNMVGSVSAATATGGSNSMKTFTGATPQTTFIRVVTGGGGVALNPEFAAVSIFR